MRFFRRGPAPQADWLVVGLGNPGLEYQNTRHNIGFMVANRLAKRARLDFGTKAADARVAEGSLGAVRVAIARPQTYVNESGRSVRRLLQRYRLDPAKLVVVYDDVDLPLGRIRVRTSGGPGTHNGMRSIVTDLQTEAFPRVRCGVAPGGSGPGGRGPRARSAVGQWPQSGRPEGDLAEYVLDEFHPDEREAAERMVQRATEALEVLLRDGVRRAMDVFNADASDG